MSSISEKTPLASPLIPTISLFYFLLGAITLLQQSLALRELFTIVHGNELSFGLCLGNWLIGVGFGSALASRQKRTAIQAEGNLRNILITLAFLSPLLLLGIRLIHQINQTQPGIYLSIAGVFLFSLLFQAPFAILTGMTFPLMGDLALGDRRVFIRFFVLEASGSMVTGVLFSIFLAGRISHLIIALTLSILVWSACLFRPKAERQNRFQIWRWLPAAGFILLLANGNIARWDRLFSEMRWHSIASGECLARVETPYQQLELGEESGQYHLYANGQLATVFPDEIANRLQASLIRCQHPFPKRILLIGEGVSGLIQALLYPRLEHLLAVDLDMQLTSLIRRFLPQRMQEGLLDPRVELAAADGRRFIAGFSGEPWDLVILHLPPPATTVLNRFFTRECFTALRRITTAGGVVAIPLLAGDAYAGGETGRFNALLYRTIRAEFPFVAISTGLRGWMFASRSDQAVTHDPGILQERLMRQEGKKGPLHSMIPYLFPVFWMEQTLQTWERFPVEINRDDHPLGYHLVHRLLGWYSGSNLNPVLNQIETFFPWRFWLFVVPGLGILAFGARLRRKAEARLSLAAASAGYAGLAIETLLISLYQSRFGHAYRDVGLIIALFMTGITVGAVLSGRGETGAQKAVLRLSFSLSALIGTALAALVLARLPLSHPWPILAIVWATGLGVGMLIPTVISLVWSSQRDLGQASGRIQAWDYLGGTIGAVLTPTVLLPFLGVTGSLTLTIFVLTTALIANYKRNSPHFS